MDPQAAYDELILRFKETRLLDSIGSVLGWDERTYMPPKGGAHRAEQMALLARLGHEHLTSPRLGELLGQVEASSLVKDAASAAAANCREIRRLHDIAVKVPGSLVEELARTTTRAPCVRSARSWTGRPCWRTSRRWRGRSSCVTRTWIR